MTQDNFVK